MKKTISILIAAVVVAVLVFSAKNTRSNNRVENTLLEYLHFPDGKRPGMQALLVNIHYDDVVNPARRYRLVEDVKEMELERITPPGMTMKWARVPEYIFADDSAYDSVYVKIVYETSPRISIFDYNKLSLSEVCGKGCVRRGDFYYLSILGKNILVYKRFPAKG